MDDTAAPLANQHGPAWDAADDAELIAAVGVALADTGGDRFLTPPAGVAALSWRVAREGPLWRPSDTAVLGSPNRCHDNVAALRDDGAELGHAYGWALSPDGMWRVHSWGVRADGTTVETTVERTAYFGVILTDDEVAALGVDEQDAASEHVRVHVTFDEPAAFAGETLWAVPVEGGYRIGNVPFFADTFALGSVVTASPLGGGLEIDGVVSYTHAGTATVAFADDVAEDDMVATADTLRAPGCRTERAAGPVWVAATPVDAVVEVLDGVHCGYEVVVFDTPEPA